MNIQDLGSVGELIAAIATIATLGYLAYQIRLNTLHSRAYTQRDLLKNNADRFAEITKFPSILRRGLTDFSALSDDEKVEFSGFMVPMAAQFEATLRLHRTGLVDQELFAAARGWILAWLTTPGGEEWWGVIRDSYSADVRTYLDAAIDQKIDLPRPLTDAMPFFKSSKDD